jgi:hypothetical protein
MVGGFFRISPVHPRRSASGLQPGRLGRFGCTAWPGADGKQHPKTADGDSDLREPGKGSSLRAQQGFFRLQCVWWHLLSTHTLRLVCTRAKALPGGMVRRLCAPQGNHRLEKSGRRILFRSCSNFEITQGLIQAELRSRQRLRRATGNRCGRRRCLMWRSNALRLLSRPGRRKLSGLL